MSTRCGAECLLVCVTLTQTNKHSAPHLVDIGNQVSVHSRMQHQSPMLQIPSTASAPVDAGPDSIVEHIATHQLSCRHGHSLAWPRQAVPSNGEWPLVEGFFLKVRLRGRPSHAGGVTDVWSGGQDHSKTAPWLLQQPQIGSGNQTLAVKCISPRHPFATCSSVLQQPRRKSLFSAHMSITAPQRGRLRLRHPRRSVLGEAAKTFLSFEETSSWPPRRGGANWRFAESKTVCGRNECEDRVDKFEAKVVCRVDDVARSVAKDS